MEILDRLILLRQANVAFCTANVNIYIIFYLIISNSLAKIDESTPKRCFSERTACNDGTAFRRTLVCNDGTAFRRTQRSVALLTNI